MRPFTIVALFSTWLWVLPTSGAAHVSERGLVLLLPTDVYTAFGLACVVATVVLTVLIPPGVFRAVFGNRVVDPTGLRARWRVPSLVSFVVFFLLVAIGFIGPRDPLENLLPLAVLSVWWIGLPLVQAIFGDVWSSINPWSGLVALLFGEKRLLTLPQGFGEWPALATYVLAVGYMISDPAPADPAHLARIATGYWFFTFLMCAIFGREWLRRGEGVSLFFGLLARLAPIAARRPFIRFPGANVARSERVSVPLGVFAVATLALGSFDGLNETFWWMGILGINPLEFPGRSAVMWPNRMGMILAIGALNLAFALTVWIGLSLIGRERKDFGVMFGRLALTLLPIALGYHVAHYLTTALVNLQYFALALDDPLNDGAAFLGLETRYITTSFFNQRHTVEMIWLTQAGAIVIAHMLAVILSHAIALRAYGTHRAAVVSQLPVAGFMVAYTLFGLWLLASPVAL